MKWLKYLKWPAIILLVLILLIGGTLGWILGTQSGLHFALNLAPRVVSGLAIGQVEGDLRNLTLKQVKYTMPGIDVSVDKVNLALRLGCLKDMTLCIENLSTDGSKTAAVRRNSAVRAADRAECTADHFPGFSLRDQRSGHRG